MQVDLRDFEKKHENMWISKMQCWALLAMSTIDNLKSFQWTRNSAILQYTDQLQHWKFLKNIYRQILIESLFLWK